MGAHLPFKMLRIVKEDSLTGCVKPDSTKFPDVKFSFGSR